MTNKTAQFLPFHAVNEFMRDDYRLEVIRSTLNALPGLPENYRNVLLLSDFEEFSNAEIAEILGLSIDTVKIRLHRARAYLKKELMCHCDLYHDENNELACNRKAGQLK